MLMHQKYMYIPNPSLVLFEYIELLLLLLLSLCQRGYLKLSELLMFVRNRHCDKCSRDVDSPAHGVLLGRHPSVHLSAAQLWPTSLVKGREQKLSRSACGSFFGAVDTS